MFGKTNGRPGSTFYVQGDTRKICTSRSLSGQFRELVTLPWKQNSMDRNEQFCDVRGNAPYVIQHALEMCHAETDCIVPLQTKKAVYHQLLVSSTQRYITLLF